LGMLYLFFFFQAEDGIRVGHVTGVQTCALPICRETLSWVIPRLSESPRIAFHGSKDAAIYCFRHCEKWSKQWAARCALLLNSPKIGRASCREGEKLRGGGGARWWTEQRRVV